MQSIEYSFLTIKSTNIREPLITRFQSISCRNQISINFCLVLRWSYECFFEDYEFCFRIYRYSISSL